jgi:transposase
MGATTNMTCQYGWARRGERYVAKAPHGHWQTSTFIAGLRQNGLIAPMVIGCPMNGEIFTAYASQVLAPALSPGDIVVLDNLSSHKGDAARRAIEAAGAEVLFLPPYSPDLNPIEQVFSKLKRGLRRAAKRSIETLWDEIGNQLTRFSPAECANYIRNSGY